LSEGEIIIFCVNIQYCENFNLNVNRKIIRLSDRIIYIGCKTYKEPCVIFSNLTDIKFKKIYDFLISK